MLCARLFKRCRDYLPCAAFAVSAGKPPGAGDRRTTPEGNGEVGTAVVGDGINRVPACVGKGLYRIVVLDGDAGIEVGFDFLECAGCTGSDGDAAHNGQRKCKGEPVLEQGYYQIL